jgi:hypothetical protein
MNEIGPVWRHRLWPGLLHLYRAYRSENCPRSDLSALLSALKERGILLRDGRTVLVDLGCGEGHTACEMIDAINRIHPRGTANYYGLDADERFVLGTERLLNEVRRSNDWVINVRQGDVLDGTLCPLRQWITYWRRWGSTYYAHSREGKDQTRRTLPVSSIASRGC